MVDITVIRILGDVPGDDIFEPILADERAALQRGRAEINKHSINKIERIVTLPYTSGLVMGKLYSVIDALQGLTYVGKLTGISHSVVMSPPQAITNITLMIPDDQGVI